jgi:hypothetical protein
MDTWSRDVDWKQGMAEGDNIGNGSGSGKVHGPTLPTLSDITLARELVDSQKRSRESLQTREEQERYEG